MAVVVGVILLAAIPTPSSVRVTRNDLVGKWVTIGGDCRGQHLFIENGKCRVWCFDSISEGEWSLRDGNKIVIGLDPKTGDTDVITIMRVERYADHTVLDVRYQDGRREQWTK